MLCRPPCAVSASLSSFIMLYSLLATASYFLISYYSSLLNPPFPASVCLHIPLWGVLAAYALKLNNALSTKSSPMSRSGTLCLPQPLQPGSGEQKARASLALPGLGTRHSSIPRLPLPSDQAALHAGTCSLPTCYLPEASTLSGQCVGMLVSARRCRAPFDRGEASRSN